MNEPVGFSTGGTTGATLGRPFAEPRLIVSNDVSTDTTTAVKAIVSDSDQLMSAILPVKGIAATNEPAPVRSARSPRSMTKLPDVIAVAVDIADQVTPSASAA